MGFLELSGVFGGIVFERFLKSCGLTNLLLSAS